MSRRVAAIGLDWADPPIGDVIRSHHQCVDEEIGELLARFDDDTAVLVISDHGAQPMEGAICTTEWLVQEGHLVLCEYPAASTPFRDAAVDCLSRDEGMRGTPRGVE